MHAHYMHYLEEASLMAHDVLALSLSDFDMQHNHGQLPTASAWPCFMLLTMAVARSPSGAYKKLVMMMC